MKATGVTHLKTKGIEISLASSAKRPPAKKPKKKKLSPKQPEQKLSPEAEIEIKHKIEEFRSVMSLDDESLIDHLFPVKEANSLEDFEEI